MTVSQSLPFLPQWLVAAGAGASPRKMRPFGICASDLALEFAHSRRPELVTELLGQCCKTANDGPVDRELLLEMPVGMRVEALLTLACLTDLSPLCWQTRCASEACGHEIEFDLGLPQIAALAEEQRSLEICETQLGEDRVVLRRPTGNDQMTWMSQTDDEQSETMLRSLLVKPSLDQLLAKGHSLTSIASIIDAAMDSFDPLVGFHLNIVCPDCGSSADVSPDLTALALERLSRAQQGLISDVHLLASRYHWTEKDVLDLPRWRRQRYLELIEEEGQ